MTAELSQLKQEVAELWARYRKDTPLAADDEGRRVLAEQNRTLETKRRALSDRSATLRHELEVHRRRASRFSPVVRVFGGLIGSVATAGLLVLVLPAVAERSVGLTTAQGAAILSGALLVLALSVSRAER
jgi:hypothetical protein